jgi:hypothetical protein
MNTTFRHQGDPVQCGWSIGRAPLALRGIRFIEGEGSAPPAAPPAGGGQAPAGQAPAAPPASPAAVAAMLAHLGKANPPAPQAPAQPAAPQQIQGFTPEQVQKLMADNAAAQKALDDALLLDSAKFQAAVKDVDLADTAKLGAAIEQFVKDHPAYAVAPTPPLPHTSGGTPAGGTTTKPTTLQGAVSAALSS